MPYTITLGQLPAGHAIDSAKPGEELRVQFREFVTSEDGDLLTSRLEGLPSDILRLTGPAPSLQPSAINHMLVLVRRDKSATVYINELQILAEVQATRTVQAGEVVLGDDVADVRKLKFSGVEIPDDVGVLFVFSIGWRRALYYDFGPFAPDLGGSRTYDIWAQLG